MSDLEDTVTPNHIELVDRINRRADIICQQLREYEEFVDAQHFDDKIDNQMKIMDLLESLETIQEAARFIKPYNLDLLCRQQALKEQMKCLEQSLDLLKLESGQQ